MLSLATALGIFITLIFFTTRELHKKVQFYIPVLVLLVFCFIGYNKLTDHEKTNFAVDKLTEKKIDSISEKRIDSILNGKSVKLNNKPNPQ